MHSTGVMAFSGLITMGFIVLRMIGIIDWDIFWVLTPSWIGSSIVIITFCYDLICITIERKRFDRKVEN